MSAATIILTGYVGKDPASDFTQSNTQRVRFPVACNRREGKDVEATDWYEVTLFGSQAKSAHEWVKKGAFVKVVGELAPRTTEQGKTFLNVDGLRWSFEGPKPAEQKSGSDWGAHAGQPRPVGAFDADTTDLPF